MKSRPVRVRSDGARRVLAAGLEVDCPELLEDLKAFSKVFGRLEEVSVELEDQAAQERLIGALQVERARMVAEREKCAQEAIDAARAALTKRGKA